MSSKDNLLKLESIFLSSAFDITNVEFDLK